jgi:hypothetical protein
MCLANRFTRHTHVYFDRGDDVDPNLCNGGFVWKVGRKRRPTWRGPNLAKRGFRVGGLQKIIREQIFMHQVVVPSFWNILIWTSGSSFHVCGIRIAFQRQHDLLACNTDSRRMLGNTGTPSQVSSVVCSRPTRRFCMVLPRHIWNGKFPYFSSCPLQPPAPVSVDNL